MITIKGSASGKFFTITQNGVTVPYNTGIVYPNFEKSAQNSKGYYTLRNVHTDALILREEPANIINGDTSAAFADYAAFEAYAEANFFRNATGGGGGSTTDASSLTTGTLADARLSTNVALKSYVNTADNLKVDKITGKGLSKNDFTDANLAVVTNTIPFQTETLDYYNRVVTAGGTLSLLTLRAIDNFIVSGKIDGWWSKLVEIGIFAGTTIDSAMVKLKYGGVSPGVLTYNNFVAADYSQDLGIGVTANTNKYLSTGFIPGNNGLSNTNFSMSFCDLGGNIFTTASFPCFMLGSTTHASGEPPIGIAPYMFGYAALLMDPPFGGPQTDVLTAGSGSVIGYTNGLKSIQLSTSYANTDFTNEIEIFRGKKTNGTTYYAPTYIGFYAFGTTLLDAECSNLNRAISTLQAAIRSTKYYGQPKALGLGDSITKGQGATSAGTNWFALVCNALGYQKINCGQGGSAAVTGAAVGPVNLAAKYINLDKLGAKTVFIALGVNDMNADAATNGNSTLVSSYLGSYDNPITLALSNGMRIILCGPSYQTAPNITKQQLWYRGCLSKAVNRNVPFCDFYWPIADQTTPSSYLSDGTHPNDAGHALLAQQLLIRISGYLERSPLCTYTPIAAGASQDITTFDVPGARAGMATTATPLSDPGSGFMYSAFVNANDTVTVRCTNITASSATPAAVKVKISVKAPN